YRTAQYAACTSQQACYYGIVAACDGSAGDRDRLPGVAAEAVVTLLGQPYGVVALGHARKDHLRVVARIGCVGTIQLARHVLTLATDLELMGELAAATVEDQQRLGNTG